jgi:hypothetical protein
MTRALFLSLSLLLASRPSLAGHSSAQSAAKTAPPPQQDLASQVPAAKPADVKSVDSILAAVYNVISGPAGERDWSRFRSLFVPDGRLSTTRSDTSSAPLLLSVDGYISRAGGYFTTHGFFENAIVNRVDRFGNVAQVFSSYESRHAPNEKPFARGINSMQLLYDGSRWWIVSILWDEESPTNPLPANMASHSSSQPAR